MKVELRRMNAADLRAIIIAKQGWDPGDLDPKKIRPLSDAEKARPIFSIIKIDDSWLKGASE